MRKRLEGKRARGGEEAGGEGRGRGWRGGKEAGGNSPLTTRSSPRAEHDEV